MAEEPEFQPITIIGWDKGLTTATMPFDPDEFWEQQKLPVAEQGAKGPQSYHVYFRLSHKPHEEWCALFNQVRRSRQRSYRCFAEDRYLVLRCFSAELEQAFSQLKDDVATANREYLEYLTWRARQQEAEHKVIEEALDGLDAGD